MRTALNGIVSSDEDKWVYEWFGFKAFSPQDIRDAIAGNPQGEELILEINSPGGSVSAGSEMYSVLKSATIPTRAEIQSLAASAASYLCLGCDKAEISPVAQMMIHLPSTVTQGNRYDHQQSINILDSTREAILNAYELKARGKTDRATLRRMMTNETWLTAQEALEHGLVDSILFVEEGAPTLSAPANVMNAFGLPDITALRAAYQQQKAETGDPTPTVDNDWQPSARLALEKLRFQEE